MIAAHNGNNPNITWILILSNIDQNSVAIFGQADRKITLSILNQSFVYKIHNLPLYHFHINYFNLKSSIFGQADRKIFLK